MSADADFGKRRLPLVVLALAVFAVGTAELLPMGLLLPISGELGVSESDAGMLVTGYALGVVFGGPAMSALTVRLPRKTLLSGLLGLFIAGGILCAAAPTYAVLMLGRIVGSLAHGVLFGTALVAAKDLSPPGKEGAGIAVVGMGLSVSVVLGAPLGTLLGQQLGWRYAFAAIALLSVAALIGVRQWMPALPRAERTPSPGSLAAAVFRPSFFLVLLTTVFGTGGIFAGFTYIAPILERISGFSESDVTVILLVFGAGSIIGNWLGGKWADRRLLPSLLGSLILLSVSMAAFAMASPHKVAAVAAVFLWGIAAYLIMTPLNVRVMQKAQGAREIASTLNISAFNLGNALGAFLGGRILDSGLGLQAVPWAASIVTLVGVLLAGWSALLDRRRTAGEKAENRSGKVRL